MRRSLVAVLILLSAVLSANVCSWAESPRECVMQIGAAIDQADVALFTRKVDVDAVVEDCLDLFLQEASKPEMKAQLPPMLALMFAQAATGEGAGRSIRALLLNESRAFLLNGIASGAFAGRKPSGQAAKGLLAPLFADASLGRKEIVGIGEAHAQGHGWRVPFTVLDDGNGFEYPIDGFIEKVNGSMRLTRICNLRELFAKIREEAREMYSHP